MKGEGKDDSEEGGKKSSSAQVAEGDQKEEGKNKVGKKNKKSRKKTQHEEEWDWEVPNPCICEGTCNPRACGGRKGKKCGYPWGGFAHEKKAQLCPWCMWRFSEWNITSPSNI